MLNWNFFSLFQVNYEFWNKVFDFFAVFEALQGS
jgi:hypothetical protein